MIRWLPAASLALLGCGGSDTPPDAFGSCSPAHDTCTGDNICIIAACQPALPRQYLVSAVTVKAPATDNQGQPWDPGGGLPDIKIELSVNSNVQSETPIQMDSLTASFPGPYGTQLAVGDTFLVGAKDDDEGSEASMIAATFMPIDAAALRPRAVHVSNGDFDLQFVINPQ